MLNPVLRPLCPRPSQKSFFSTSIDPNELMKVYVFTNDWSVHKLLLRHKDCPDTLTEKFLECPVWYMRLTAGLAKKNRHRHIATLFSDKKSTVRAAAYKTAITDNLYDMTMVCRMIIADKWVHGYFYGMYWNIELLTRIASGEIDRESWEHEAHLQDARRLRLTLG